MMEPWESTTGVDPLFLAKKLKGELERLIVWMNRSPGYFPMTETKVDAAEGAQR